MGELDNSYRLKKYNSLVRQVIKITEKHVVVRIQKGPNEGKKLRIYSKAKA